MGGRVGGQTEHPSALFKNSKPRDVVRKSGIPSRQLAAGAGCMGSIRLHAIPSPLPLLHPRTPDLVVPLPLVSCSWVLRQATARVPRAPAPNPPPNPPAAGPWPGRGG